MLALARKPGTIADGSDAVDGFSQRQPVDNDALLCQAHQLCLVDVTADRVEAWNAEVVTPQEWAALMTL